MAGATPRSAEAPFVGEAADGMVYAEVDATGRLSTLRIDPKLAREPLEDISAYVQTAVNAALDAHPGRPDVGPLLDELKEVQERSVAEMARISQAFTAALNQAMRK